MGGPPQVPEGSRQTGLGRSAAASSKAQLHLPPIRIGVKGQSTLCYAFHYTRTLSRDEERGEG